jgi:hypothetical protein
VCAHLVKKKKEIMDHSVSKPTLRVVKKKTKKRMEIVDHR